VGLGYVRASDGAVINADWVKAGSYEVNVGGQLYPVSVSLKPLYDPTNARIRP
jgi:glycine cleavage system aminomethyltransferase T